MRHGWLERDPKTPSVKPQCRIEYHDNMDAVDWLYIMTSYPSNSMKASFSYYWPCATKGLCITHDKTSLLQHHLTVRQLTERLCAQKTEDHGGRPTADSQPSSFQLWYYPLKRRKLGKNPALCVWNVMSVCVLIYVSAVTMNSDIISVLRLFVYKI
jgi:hypothetical protein